MSYHARLLKRFGAAILKSAALRAKRKRTKGTWRYIRALNVYELTLPY